MTRSKDEQAIEVAKARYVRNEGSLDDLVNAVIAAVKPMTTPSPLSQAEAGPDNPVSDLIAIEAECRRRMREYADRADESGADRAMRDRWLAREEAIKGIADFVRARRDSLLPSESKETRNTGEPMTTPSPLSHMRNGVTTRCGAAIERGNAYYEWAYVDCPQCIATRASWPMTTPLSRSMQRRIAAQKGEPMPSFEHDADYAAVGDCSCPACSPSPLSQAEAQRLICECGHHRNDHYVSLKGVPKQSCFDCNHCACEGFRSGSQVEAIQRVIEALNKTAGILQALVSDIERQPSEWGHMRARVVNELSTLSKSQERQAAALATLSAPRQEAETHKCGECRHKEELLKATQKSGKVWICHHRLQFHEVGCPHREWTESELRDAGFGHLIDQFSRQEADAQKEIELRHCGARFDDGAHSHSCGLLFGHQGLHYSGKLSWASPQADPSAEIERLKGELEACRKGLFHRITGWDKDGQTPDQILDEVQELRNTIALLRSKPEVEALAQGLQDFAYGRVKSLSEIDAITRAEKAEAELASLRSAATRSAPEQGNRIEQPEKVTRFEVIDGTGRAYVLNPAAIELHYQDDGRTLKVFTNRPPLTVERRPEPEET